LTDIGTIYFKGELVKQDSERAIRFWEAAVEQNHPVAKYQLGVILRDGNTVSQDHRRAIKLFSEAAEQIPIAAYNTGSMIFHGMGVPKSQKLAYAWFKIAKVSNAAAKENGTFLAATYGAPQASEVLAELSKMISQSEVQLGDRLFEHCFKKSFRGCLSLCTSLDEENCAMLK
jgi:hypothetical protein